MLFGQDRSENQKYSLKSVLKETGNRRDASTALLGNMEYTLLFCVHTLGAEPWDTAKP